MERKKLILATIILVVAFVAGFYLYQASNRDTEKNNVRVGYSVESVNNAPIIVASERSLFKKHHLNVKLIPFKSGKEIRDALAANQVDIAFGAYTNMMSSMAKGVPIRVISGPAQARDYVLVLPESGIKELSDLKGKKVASGLTSVSGLNFQIALTQEGIDSKSITLVDVSDNNQLPALINKSVDAVVISEQDTDKFIKAGAQILPGWEKYSSRLMPRGSVIANVNFMNEHQDITENFLDAFIESQKYINDNPKDAAEIVTRHIDKMSSGGVIYATSYVEGLWVNGKLVNSIWTDPKTIMEITKKAYEVGSLSKDLKEDEIFDFRFKEKLENAQDRVFK